MHLISDFAVDPDTFCLLKHLIGGILLNINTHKHSLCRYITAAAVKWYTYCM